METKMKKASVYAIPGILGRVTTLTISDVVETVQNVLGAVDGYSAPMEVLSSKTRKRPVCERRQLSILMLTDKELLGMTVTNVGVQFNRNHATVCNGIKTMRNLISTDKKYAAIYDICRTTLLKKSNEIITENENTN
jgi:chromosomal replication initiation ATPase DnaA